MLKISRNVARIYKTVFGIVYNLAAFYLITYSPFYIYKGVGVLGLLFSYFIFHLEVRRDGWKSKEVKGGNLK